VDPVTSPLEAVDAASAHRAAQADAAVVAAWSAHHEEVFAFLVRTTRSPDVAEDLLQEAYLRLTTEIRAGRAPDNTRAWLYRVGANLAVSRGRRLAAAFRGIVKIRGTSAPSTTTLTPEASYLQREGRADLLAALADLGPDARAALLLSAEGFAGAEIAAAIGRTELATRTLLCRTRVHVRQRLEGGEAVR
jgi:RNA polymerase sigma-70 factor, ECF subfamily